MSHKVSWLAFWIGIVVGAIVGFSGIHTQLKWAVVVGVIIMIASLVQTCFFCCCPHCKKTLNIRGGKPKYCPECGGKIEW